MPDAYILANGSRTSVRVVASDGWHLQPDLVAPERNRTDELREKVAFVGSRVLNIAPGRYVFDNPTDGAGMSTDSVVATLAQSLSIRAEDATFVHRWNPLYPDSLGQFFNIRAADTFSIEGLTYDLSPRPDTQGVVTQIAGTDFFVAVEPGHEPAWADGSANTTNTADNMIGITDLGGGNYGAFAFKYKVAGASRPFPFVPHVVGGVQQTNALGWKIWKGSPQDFSLFPRSAGPFSGDPPIVSYNPLIIHVRPQDFSEGAIGQGRDFPGALGAILNGNWYQFEPVEDGTAEEFTYTVQVLDINGEPVDASAATGVDPAPGAFVIPAVPSWMTPGTTVVVQCRKRQASPIYFRGARKVKIDMTFRHSSNVAVWGWDFENLHLNVVGKGDGYMACTGGPVNLFNGRGTISGSIDWTGSGDDVFAPRTTPMQGRISAFGADWIEGDYFIIGQPHVKKATLPRVGDKVEFSLRTDSANITTRTALSLAQVGTTAVWRVTFDGALPAGFDPTTWSVINRSACATVNMTRIRAMGCIGRAFLNGCSSADVGEVISIGCAFASVLCPLGNGYKGGMRIGRLVEQDVTLSEPRRKNADGAANRVGDRGTNRFSSPSGWAPNVIGEHVLDGYSYTGWTVYGVDTTIGSRVVRRGGQSRPVSPPTDPDNFDYVVGYATLTLVGQNGTPDYVENWQTDTGGSVVFTSNTATTQPPTDSSTNIATTAFAEPRFVRNFNVRMADGVTGTYGLNAAIAAANASGSRSTVTLPAGVMNLSTTTPVTAITGNNITIKGQGNASQITAPAGHDGRVFTATAGNRLTIRDLFIDQSAATTASKQAFAIDGVTDARIYNIGGSGGYGLVIHGAVSEASRVYFRDIIWNGAFGNLGGRFVDIRRGSTLIHDRVFFRGGQGAGTSTTRAIYIKPEALVDTVRFNECVIWNAGGAPTLITLDFSDFNLANLYINGGVYDSSLAQAMEVISTGTTLTYMSVFNVANARFATDGGAGIKLLLTNPNSFIKSLDFANNYIVSKSATEPMLDFNAASTGILRAARVHENSFADAYNAGTPNPAAVLIGMDGIQFEGNTLSTTNEATAEGLSNTAYFFKATKAAQRIMLLGNVANIPVTGLLDESAFTLAGSKRVSTNYPTA
jgi:hypothetical protein